MKKLEMTQKIIASILVFRYFKTASAIELHN